MINAMRITNIHNTPAQNNRVVFGSNNTTHKKHSPVHEAAATTAIWFGFGIGLDYVTRKIKFYNSPTKNSFAVNGLISLIAGTCAGIKAFGYNRTNRN